MDCGKKEGLCGILLHSLLMPYKLEFIILVLLFQYGYLLSQQIRQPNSYLF